MNENICVAFCTDRQNIPFLAVSLQSIIEHSSDGYVYDIYVVHDGMTSEQFGYLRLIAKKRKNIQLNFIGIKDKKDEFDRLYVSGHITSASYWRFALPILLPRVEKLIYLDTDVVVLEDLSLLWNEVCIDNYFLAGVPGVGVAGNLNEGRKSREFLKGLGYSDFSKYVNAGVLVLNAKKIRDENSFQKLITMANQYDFPMHDQDCLNFVFDGKIQILDWRWNFAIHEKIDNYPEWLKEKVHDRISSMNLSIIHYVGAGKPWRCMFRPLRELWIMYAIKTPFFCGTNFSPNSVYELDIRESTKVRWGRRLERVLIPNFLHRLKKRLKSSITEE